MRAIRLHAFGDPDVLVLDSLADLSPGPGQVRIAVEASGVHLLDTSLRRGEAGPLPLPELPTVPGREVAGVVDVLGSEVDGAWLGQRVVAHLGPVPGGYAEQAVTAVSNLIAVPGGLTLAEAVALVGTGRTAEGILEQAGLAAHDVVLIPAAAGGLGWLLTQAARAVGATVIAAVGGAEKVERLRDLGVEALDYRGKEWANGIGRSATVVLDGVGGEIGHQAMHQLAPGGRLLMFGYSSGSPTEVATADLIALNISAGWNLGPRMFARPGGIRGLAEQALARGARGEWRPLVSAYPLQEAARAHRDLEERRTVGKVVLTPRRGWRS
jgi:NADPH2:quinone reductase